MDKLSFNESSNRGAEAIVFIHGGGISSRMWSGVLEELSEFHCLAPDLPGHGNSIELRPFTLEGSVEGISRLIQDQIPSGITRVVAFSVGVPVAIELGNRYPDRIKMSFLSGPTPKMGRVTSVLMNAISRPVLSLLGERQRARMVANSMGLSDEVVQAFHDDLNKISAGLVTEINNVVASQGDPLQGSPPAVVLVGEKEFGATKKRARELSLAYGNGEVYVVREHGHAWSLEDPGLFHRTIRSWMKDESFGAEFRAWSS